MLFIISILFVFVFIALLHRQIKKYANVFYVISALISIAFIVYFKMKLNINVPENINKYLITIFSRGAISTAMFTIVMYMGVLNRSSSLTRLLMPIRAELSIIACIFTLGHNILYGISFFPQLFTSPGEMPILKLIATLLTIIIMCIMLPLMITSFPGVRKKMKFKKWKNLQRLAYPFYGLIYIHIMCLFIPKMQNGKFLDIIIYSIIFLSYFVLRLYKYSKDKKHKESSIKNSAI